MLSLTATKDRRCAHRGFAEKSNDLSVRLTTKETRARVISPVLRAHGLDVNTRKNDEAGEPWNDLCARALFYSFITACAACPERVTTSST